MGPCMAITLINPKEPQYAASYHWCRLETHDGGMHECYCGIWWLSTDLVEPTEGMISWRTGNLDQMKAVTSKLYG